MSNDILIYPKNFLQQLYIYYFVLHLNFIITKNCLFLMIKLLLKTYTTRKLLNKNQF